MLPRNAPDVRGSRPCRAAGAKHYIQEDAPQEIAGPIGERFG
jgi:hypothetical protein